MKIIKAVSPYIYDGQINFKHKPYNAWRDLSLPIAKPHYPLRLFHGLIYKYNLPSIYKSKKEARLRFMQPYSISFDAFPDYLFYEIIPFFWDVWSDNIERTCAWMKKYDVKTAIFTSSQVVEMVKKRFPKMNIIWCPEGNDTKTYSEGKSLKDRSIDFFHYGREIDSIVKYDFNGIKYISGKKDGVAYLSQSQLVKCLSDAKIVAAYPKSWTNPEEAGGIETLTQRYWECMLSRCVMIGHAPKELVDLLGYNPVIELDRENSSNQLRNVLGNIENYQVLVDKNREMALEYGDWKNRMNELLKKLNEIL